MDARRLYEDRAEADRGTSRGLLIPTEEQYRERLRITAGLIELVQPRSVLDLGCGYADLADQLPVDLAYVGIEMTRWIYREARQRHPDLMLILARIEDLHAETAFDVVALVGVLATTPPRCWPELARRVRVMARKAIVVSWLEYNRYQGSLVAGWEADIARLFGTPEAIVDIPGDATRTALVRVS
jgi:SAM-dependent methyltransferase